MSRGGQIVAFTVLVMVLGTALIKGCGKGVNDDPVAAVENGAPRGLLALSLLLADQKIPAVVLRRFDDVMPAAGHASVLVPPPEMSSWTDTEAKELLARVRAGDRVLVLCDDDEFRNQRLAPLLEAAGVECTRADVPIGDESLTKATGVMPRFSRALYVRGAGRAKSNGRSPVFPAWTSGPNDVVVKRAMGEGIITVLGSATVVTNDGIAKADNAAFAVDELAGDGRTVIIDQRHHGSRSKVAFLDAATRGTGPITALVALLLLVPLSLLSLAPRPGDPPGDDEERSGAPAAEAQARALAALLMKSKRPRRR